MKSQNPLSIKLKTIAHKDYIEGGVNYPVSDISSIETITQAIYEEIFEIIEKAQMKISFIRHMVPRINESLPNGITAYEMFNKGRYSAYVKHFGENMNNWHIPSASAIGNNTDSIKIEFKASKKIVRLIENKCQVPASKYSEKYGKFPPVFSRACIIEEKDKIKMLASGTASIKGEDSQHTNDIHNQLFNSLENLKILGSQYNLKQYGLEFGFSIEDISRMVVYYKNSGDLSILKAAIPKFLSSKCDVKYLQRDICRDELLVELEPVFIAC